MDIQKLSLNELADASARAEGSKVARDAYKLMLAALDEAPEIRERLAFDMLKEAEKLVTESAEPWDSCMLDPTVGQIYYGTKDATIFDPG